MVKKTKAKSKIKSKIIVKRKPKPLIQKRKAKVVKKSPKKEVSKKKIITKKKEVKTPIKKMAAKSNIIKEEKGQTTKEKNSKISFITALPKKDRIQTAEGWKRSLVTK